MDQAALIEDIITTKNTLTILHRTFTVNRISLQQFTSVFDLITELIALLTHLSVAQIKTGLQSSEPTLIFNKLKDTLNKLGDAIITKNTSTINILNDRLSSCVQQFRICSSYAANNEETADNVFKKQLQQSSTDEKYDSPKTSIPHSSHEHVSSPSLSPPTTTQNEPSVTDPFAGFRFARRRRYSSSSGEDEDIAQHDSLCELTPLPLPPPPSSPRLDSTKKERILCPTKSSATKPRLMISYNHESKPLCLDIYNRLTNDGYKVWIDLKQMHGSTLVAMAQGIESSDVILYCITEKYSQSPSCQKEAEYAFVQQKIMIPLLFQSKYKPKGWLGLLLGTALYIDFTKNDFTQNYQKLKNEIEANAERINDNQNNGAELPTHLTTSYTKESHETTNHYALRSTKTQSEAAVSERKARSCVLF